MGAKRNSKFYSQNEKEIMKKLGLNPTKASGAGWIEKEDGFNDEIIAQHKSTDASSYRIRYEDIEKLEYHALVDHKIPVFVIQFLKSDDIFLLLRPEYLEDIYNYLEIPKSSSKVKSDIPEIIEIETETSNISKKIIKSGNKEKYEKFRIKELEEKNKKFKEKLKQNQRSKLWKRLNVS